MEFRNNIPEVQKLVEETKALGEKTDVSWAEVVSIERSALDIWFSKPELRDAVHHKFTAALAKLHEIDHKHMRVSDAVFMLHNIAMHPNTGRGLIEGTIEYSVNFGLQGELTRQDIESLMEIVQKDGNSTF